MKRILILIDSLGCGGAEKSLISLLPFLAARNYEITLMVRNTGGLFESYVPDNVHLQQFPYTTSKLQALRYSISLRLPWNRKVHTAELYWQNIGKYYPALREKYDVAIAYQQGFPTFYIANKVNAKKKICWINADISGVGYSAKFCNQFYTRYDRIMTVSDALRKQVLYPEYVSDKNKITTCWDILNSSQIRTMALEKSIKVSSDNRIHFTTVGRLVPLKGFDLAIQAAQILKDRNIDFIWHFVGGGGLYNELKSIIDANGLTENVILEGEQLNPYPYIAAADIYVQTSRFEGFGLTIGEAKILGKPIVSTNFPVVYNQITDGKNGLIVEMSAKAIANGITRLVNDTALREALAAAVGSEHNNTAETESNKVINIIESDL